MPSKYDTYTSPLAERNASAEMLRLWSPRHKFNTWRRIWLAVAEAQHELTGIAEGAPSASSGSERSSWTGPPLVTKEQVEELRAVVTRQNPDGTTGITDAEMAAAEKYERDLRHDVMAHVHALGDSCPKAKGIIHLGMTSQDVVCNADMLVFWSAIHLIATKVHRVVIALGDQASTQRSVPTLGFTHYQPAQPLTVGRRFANWAYDLLTAGKLYADVVPSLRGLKGATGTQASFLSLFNNDASLVDELEARFVHALRSHDGTRGPFPLDQDSLEAERQLLLSKAGTPAFSKRIANLKPESGTEFIKRDRIRLGVGLTHALTGQTYPRVVDTAILADLASTAAVLHKIATDIRLLCNRKELDEPFETRQIGSSAMPYKRNPMRCERICGLTRFVMNLVGNAYDTAATQWLERTLDDSSNRRLSLPEAFLALDGALDLMHNVASGLIVHEAMVKKNLMAELPFMATENILMACVKLGADRQHYHELIRVHSQAAGSRVKDEGLDNDLLDRLRQDQNFWSKARGGPLAAELDWDNLLDPMKYVGRSVEQTERFIKEVVEPLREQYGEAIAELGESGPRV
jgi:adenylosuccinate lyase